jgi:hypothetical protein
LDLQELVAQLQSREELVVVIPVQLVQVQLVQVPQVQVLQVQVVQLFVEL